MLFRNTLLRRPFYFIVDPCFGCYSCRFKRLFSFVAYSSFVRVSTLSDVFLLPYLLVRNFVCRFFVLPCLSVPVAGIFFCAPFVWFPLHSCIFKCLSVCHTVWLSTDADVCKRASRPAYVIVCISLSADVWVHFVSQMPCSVSFVFLSINIIF